MNKIAIKLTKMICQEYLQITELQMLRMQYGIECFLQEFSKFVIFLILFSIISLFSEYLTVFCFLFILRPFIGGYHAKTNIVCWIISFLIFGIIIFAGRLVELSTMQKTIILVFSIFIALIFAPVEHRNKQTRDRCLKKKFKVFAILATSAAGLVSYILPGYYSEIAFLSILSVALMALAGYLASIKSSSDNLISNIDM